MQPGQQQPGGEQPPQGPPPVPPTPPSPAQPGPPSQQPGPYPPQPGPYPHQPGPAPQQPGPYAQQPGQQSGPAPAPGSPPPGAGAPPWGQPAAPGPQGGDTRRRTVITVVASVAAIALTATGVLVLGSEGGDGGGAKDGRIPAANPGLIGGDDGADPAASAGTSGGASNGTGEGTGSTGGGQQPAGEVVKPANSSGPDGTTVLIGESDARATLDVYEDLRCPPCAQFEQNVGETIIKDIEAGKYKASFHMATFLDTTMGGTGSKNALSALGAALDHSPESFLAYKKALYAEPNHPREGADSFADDAYLLKVADQVPGLKTDPEFQNHVRAGTFDAWAQKMSAAFTASGVQGTPTVKLNGTQLTGEGGVGAPTTAADFTKAVDARL